MLNGEGGNRFSFQPYRRKRPDMGKGCDRKGERGRLAREIDGRSGKKSKDTVAAPRSTCISGTTYKGSHALNSYAQQTWRQRCLHGGDQLFGGSKINVEEGRSCCAARTTTFPDLPVSFAIHTTFFKSAATLNSAGV
eukprot:6206490-Pleurochrysis_carterae.AAC.1